MKSLSVVQTIAKVSNIVIIVVFCCTILGAVGALLGGVCLLVVVPNLSADVVEMIQSAADVSTLSGLGIELIAESIHLVGLAVALGFFAVYLKQELADGTPFTHHGARKLLQVGIINLAVPFGTFMVASIMTAVAEGAHNISNEYDVIPGVVMILLSFIFHYGADLVEQNESEHL